MTTMDVKSISWVDDVYQKFEAMCVEVEEAMYQDSVKYVENQVKTVGDCFKRFYSDVMQDLIPPSSDDPLKLEKTCQNSAHYADDGIYDKSVVYVKRGVNSESEHLGRDSDLASQLDEMVDSKLASGSYDSIGLYKLPSDKSNSVKCPGLPAKQSGSEELCFCGNNESELKVLPTEISNPENVDSQSAFLSKGSETTAELGKMSDEINGTVEYTSATSTSSDPAVDEFGKDDDMLKMSDGNHFYDCAASTSRLYSFFFLYYPKGTGLLKHQQVDLSTFDQTQKPGLTQSVDVGFGTNILTPNPESPNLVPVKFWFEGST